MISPKPAVDLGLDIQDLTKQLDRTKSAVFLGSNAAFLGSLMCSLNFYWTGDLMTAATDGVNLMWNPHWFLKLNQEQRKTILMHELWHPARLHGPRCGSRIHRLWNYACDIKINNDLTKQGYSFQGLEWVWRDPSIPDGMPEEDIYDILVARGAKPIGGSWQPPEPGEEFDPTQYQGEDMLPPPTKDDQYKAINNAIRAYHEARSSGGAVDMPGDIEIILKQFLAPIVPWDRLLHRFMQDLITTAYTWRRPNRRFSEMYMPSRYEDEGRLDHLIYYQDVSGSISDADNIRFNSEVKYIKDHYNPKKLTLCQFDTRISQERVFLEEDSFEEIKIVGRGGTSLICVREHILQHKPTAVVVFSDLECEPMEPLGVDIPIIWVCISNSRAKVPFGKLIHIR